MQELRVIILTITNHKSQIEMQNIIQLIPWNGWPNRWSGRISIRDNTHMTSTRLRFVYSFYNFICQIRIIFTFCDLVHSKQSPPIKMLSFAVWYWWRIVTFLQRLFILKVIDFLKFLSTHCSAKSFILNLNRKFWNIAHLEIWKNYVNISLINFQIEYTRLPFKKHCPLIWWINWAVEIIELIQTHNHHVDSKLILDLALTYFTMCVFRERSTSFIYTLKV